MTSAANSQGVMEEIAASQTAMEEIATSQTAMAEVANSQTAINKIGSSTNKNITANTVLNSTTATAELKNSNVKQTFEKSFNFAANSDGPITDKRILVTSNNTSGDSGTGITYENDVGPETQADTTFIVNGANSNDPNRGGGGTVGFEGIEIK